MMYQNQLEYYIKELTISIEYDILEVSKIQYH